MNKTNVACEILKIEANLSLTRAAMLQDNMSEYVIHLQKAQRGMIELINETITEDNMRALITK